MSREALGKFYAEVMKDRALQDQLKVAGPRDEFVARVVRVGGQRGYQFTAAEVETELNRRTHAQELTDAELSAVAGGLARLPDDEEPAPGPWG